MTQSTYNPKFKYRNINETSQEWTDEHSIHSECYLMVYFTSMYSVSNPGK